MNNILNQKIGYISDGKTCFLENNPYPFEFRRVAFTCKPILFGDFSNGFFGKAGWIESECDWSQIKVQVTKGVMVGIGDTVEYDFENVLSVGDIVGFGFYSEFTSTTVKLNTGGEFNIRHIRKVSADEKNLKKKI